MANIYEVSEEQAREYAEWVASRPPIVRAICERIAPNKLYRLKTTGQRVTLHSVNESGTVTVNVTGEYNLTDFDCQVFGVNPNDLDECDLPDPREPLGTLVADEHLPKYLERIRPIILAARAANPLDPYGKTKQ